jgi:proliferating cell nuclear antigen
MTLEATVDKAALWKRVIDSMKDLVNEANFEFSQTGISIQSMDSAHVALVSLGLGREGFTNYQCFRQRLLGINLGALAKVLKVIDNDDIVTIRHEEDTDVLTLVADSGDKKKSEYQMKLMEIESEALGIPEMEYAAHLSIPSEVFARIMRDMAIFGETVTLDVAKDHIKFSGFGDFGDGNTTLMSAGDMSRVKSVKREVKQEIKSEPTDDAPIDAPIRGDDKKKKPTEKSDEVYISTEEPLQLSFALRYLTTFAKGSSLSDRVEISLAKDSPCRIEYKIENVGFLRWYLAPKVDDSNQ